jgi:hypothetical protein
MSGSGNLLPKPSLEHEAPLEVIRQLEALMASPKFHSTFVDGLLQQGEVKSKSEDLLKVIHARGLEPTELQLNFVTSCPDLSQLAAWFDRALDAKTADEIFGAH